MNMKKVGWLFLVLVMSISLKAEALPYEVLEGDAEREFLQTIREHIAERNPISEENIEFKELFEATVFPKQFNGFAMVLYQPGEKRILVARREATSYESLRTVINRSMKHPRIDDFDVLDSEKCRIQIDFVTSNFERVYFDQLSTRALDENRLEVGVDGFRISSEGKSYYFLPGDAFVRSILGKGQLRRHIKKLTKTKVPVEDLKILRFFTESFVSFKDAWLPLYRGYPVFGAVGKKDLEEAALAAVDYVRKYQNENGSFLYYYDPAKDTIIDYLHPTRTLDNLYNNILRHSGGASLFLDAYKVYKDPALFEPTRKGIEYLIQNLVRYELPSGEEAGYIFYNKKSKLGGSGLALYVMALYAHLSGDNSFEEEARLLQKHLLAEIRESGEFYYYHIYPGREKDDPASFSFYYPGEALVGLAFFHKTHATNDEKVIIEEKVHRALDFLLNKRPEFYAEHFTSLPSDSWLMIAINELWDIEAFQREEYKNFVFSEADAMVRLSYTREDALFPDYIGSMYYDYGDPPYPDGARGEGVTAAFLLANKVGSEEHMKRYSDRLKSLSWATLHLINTEESTYSVDNSEMTIGGIRFKPTRQWFRIDTIDHVAAYYLRFLPYWDEDELFDPFPATN